MKLERLSLLALLTLSKVLACEFKPDEDVIVEEDDDEDIDDVFLVLPKIENWEYVPEDKCAVAIESGEEVESRLFSWSISSLLGGFFQPGTSPAVKKSESLPSLDVADLNIRELARVLNCEPDQLMEMNLDNLKSLATFASSPSANVLSRLTDIGDLALFELYFKENMALILSEVKTTRDFHAVIFNCIKIKSMNSFFNITITPKFPLNGPQVVVFSAMYGSIRILKFILDQKESVNHNDYDWTWKNIDGSSDIMLNFGKDPLSAALFLAALKTISNDHLNCLLLLIEANVNLEANNYYLLKESAVQPNLDSFIMILDHTTSPIPISIMNEILLLAIKNNNEVLVNHLITLNYAFNVLTHVHLIPAISTNNPSLFHTILALIKVRDFDRSVLIHAADSGNDEIFLAIAKLSRREIVLNLLFSLISNARYHRHVSLIHDNVALSTGMCSQVLMQAIRIGSGEFVDMFLSPKVAFKAAFSIALESNNMAVIEPFFAKFKDSELLVSSEKKLTTLMNTLFELKAWNSLHVLVSKFFNVREFPRHLFLAMIMETDQVEIAKTASTFGVAFPQCTINDIPNVKMREFVLSQTSTTSRRK